MDKAQQRATEEGTFVNECAEPAAIPTHPAVNTAEHPSSTYPNVYLPRKIYEALPVAYVSAGALFILGAIYTDNPHWSTVGYLIVGLACIFGGFTVDSIRRRERPKP